MTVPKRPVARRIVRKTKPDESWVACYDQNGTLIGIVDPDKITPISDAAGDDPKPAPAATPEQAAMAKQQRIQELRKGLNAPRTAAENDQHAAAMGDAAAKVLAAILARPSGGAPTGRRR